MSSEGTPIACPTPSQALSNCISASARKGRRLSHVREADAARRSSLRGTDGLIPIPANAATQAARRRGCARKTLRRSFLLSTPPSRTALSSSFGTGSMTRSPQFKAAALFYSTSYSPVANCRGGATWGRSWSAASDFGPPPPTRLGGFRVKSLY